MTIKNFAAFSKITNKAWYFMRIVCWQSCNIMPYFCRKLRKMSQNLSSAAVVIGALRVNDQINWYSECVPERISWKVDFEKNQTTKIMKTYPACKEFTVLMELFCIWLVHLRVFSFVNIAKSLMCKTCTFSPPPHPPPSYIPSTIFQLCRDGSCWVEPVLS